MSKNEDNGSPFTLNVKSQHEFYVLLSTIGMCSIGLIAIIIIFIFLRKKYPQIYWRTVINIYKTEKTPEYYNYMKSFDEIRLENINSSQNSFDEINYSNEDNINIEKIKDPFCENINMKSVPIDYFKNTFLKYVKVNKFLKIWFYSLFASNHWLYTYLGFDTLVIVSTLRLFLLLSSICSFFNFVCVIPTNIISNTAKPINTSNIISRIGISNIPKGSSLLWVHFVLLYAYTILMYLLIFYFWKILVYWKQRYFVDNSSLHRSFIIQNLPSDMVDETQISNFLRKYVNLDRDKTILHIFKNSFHFIKHTKSSDKLLYKLSLNKQHLLKDILFSKNSTPLTINKEETNLNDTTHVFYDNEQFFKIDSLKTYQTYCDDYQNYLSLLCASLNEAYLLENVPFAFVSFSDIETAHTLAISDVNIDINTQNCILAPEPNGIQYRNFIHSNYTRLTLKIIVWISTMVFVMFWTVPFGLISQLSNSINYPQFSKFAYSIF